MVQKWTEKGFVTQSMELFSYNFEAEKSRNRANPYVDNDDFPYKNATEFACDVIRNMVNEYPSQGLVITRADVKDYIKYTFASLVAKNAVDTKEFEFSAQQFLDYISTSSMNPTRERDREKLAIERATRPKRVMHVEVEFIERCVRGSDHKQCIISVMGGFTYPSTYILGDNWDAVVAKYPSMDSISQMLMTTFEYRVMDLDAIEFDNIVGADGLYQ